MIRPGSEPALRSTVSKPEKEKEKEKENEKTNLMMEIKYKDNEADIYDGTKSVLVMLKCHETCLLPDSRPWLAGNRKETTVPT